MAGAGLSATALAPITNAFAQARSDRLVVTSNAGDADTPASLTLIHPDSLEVLLTLPAPAAFSFPATRWAFKRDVIWGGTGTTVAGYSLDGGDAVASIETGSKQNYTELTPDGRYVVNAARYADKVMLIDAAAGTPDLGRVIGEVALYEGAQPCDMTMLADGSYAFTPDRGGETISVFSLDPFELVVTAPLERLGEEPLQPFMATVSPRGDMLFVENARDRSVSAIDVRDPAHPVEARRFLVADGLLAEGAITDEFTPDGRYNCIICRNASALTVVDIDRLEIIGQVPFPEGSNPIAGTFTPEGNRMFVPLPGRDAVAVVAVPAFKVEALIPVPPGPRGAVYLENPLPKQQGMFLPLGLSLATGRTWPKNCPDLCCGKV
jgi:hypothetical protein